MQTGVVSDGNDAITAPMMAAAARICSASMGRGGRLGVALRSTLRADAQATITKQKVTSRSLNCRPHWYVAAA